MSAGAFAPKSLSPRGTIVIAEDEVATRLLLCRVLERESFLVYAVKNGQLACDEARLRRPDVIVLDWGMPLMDGLRAAELLKADADTRSIPILMLTTHAQIEDRRIALAAGVQDFLIKPFDARQLVVCIDQQLRRRTTR